MKNKLLLTLVIGSFILMGVASWFFPIATIFPYPYNLLGILIIVIGAITIFLEQKQAQKMDSTFDTPIENQTSPTQDAEVFPKNQDPKSQIQNLGDVDQSLSNFYENALQNVRQTPGLEIPEITLRNWFSRELITPAGTRGSVYREVRQTGSLSNRAVELLEKQFLIRAESRAGGTWYELVHDRFVDPILEANQAWHTNRQRRNPLAQPAQLWWAEQRNPNGCYKAMPSCLADNI